MKLFYQFSFLLVCLCFFSTNSFAQCEDFVLSYTKLDCSETEQTEGTFSIMLEWSGGEGPYMIDGSTEEEDYSDTSLILTGIVDDSELNFVVTDANECEASASVTGESCVKCTLGASYEKLDCTEDQQDAGEFSILVTITDGTAPYSVESSIFTDDVDSVFEISNIADGTAFDLEVSDADGCVFTLAIAGETCAKDNCTIPVEAEILECTEAQTTSGEYSVEFTWGGVGPFTLEGDVNEEEYDGNSFTLFDLVDGSDYTLQVTDADGCTGLVTGSGSCAKCQISLDISATCNDDGDAYDVIILISNGTAPYSIAGTYNDDEYNSDVLEINTITAGDEYTVVITDVNGCSIEASGSEDCKLNVDLLSFEGGNSDLGNTLTWETGTEENSDYFILERSINGVDFVSVVTLEAAGNSNTLLHYAYTDENVEPCSIYFYRLVEVALNGDKAVISDIVRLVEGGDCYSVEVMPIPATDELTISINSSVATNTSVVIYDVLGRMVSNQSFTTNEGLNQIPMNISNFSAGTYIIAIGNEAQSTVTKFIKR